MIATGLAVQPAPRHVVKVACSKCSAILGCRCPSAQPLVIVPSMPLHSSRVLSLWARKRRPPLAASPCCRRCCRWAAPGRRSEHAHHSPIPSCYQTNVCRVIGVEDCQPDGFRWLSLKRITVRVPACHWPCPPASRPAMRGCFRSRTQCACAPTPLLCSGRTPTGASGCGSLLSAPRGGVPLMAWR